MSEKSVFDMWIEGRFGYAIPALKITIVTLVSVILMNYYDSSFLLRELVFPNPITYGHILGYLVAASSLMLVMYYAGGFWMDLSIWGIKKTWRLLSSSEKETAQ